jgi:hypothetical protein
MPDETERIRCRYCGNEDRASEGYPCQGCGTFICIICSIRGITTCRECEKTGGAQSQDSQGETR